MRYKQDLAKFLPIADGARLIQERAGITEDDAREDIVLAVQDYTVRCLLWDVSKGARRHLDFEHIKRELLRSLASDQVDWGKSVVRHRHSFYHYLVEIEVSRSSLDLLWPDSTPIAPNLTDASRTKGGSTRNYEVGLQEFIDQLFFGFKERGVRLTPPGLKAWLEENALPNEGYDPEPQIPDCGEIEFYDNLVWWKDRKGHPKSKSIRTIERYILRAKNRASDQAT